MFEKLPFLHMELSEQPMDQSHPQFWEELQQFQEERKIYFDTAAVRAEYRNVGHLSLLPTPPISAFASDGLLTVQSFHIMDAKKGFFTRRKDYQAWMLLLTLGGRGHLEYRGHSYTLEQGDCFWIDCREPHHYWVEDEGWRHAVLHFDGFPAQALGQVFLQRPSVKFSMSHELEEQLEVLLETVCGNRVYREVLVSEGLYRLLTGIITQSEQGALRVAIPEAIRQLTAYMESNYSADLTLDELSRFSNISKYHLSREFRKHTGMPPHEYLIRIRLDNAKTLLKTTNYTVSTIGSLVGIPDPNNFHYLFKRYCEVTPGQWRKTRLSNPEL